jgi:MscS family membrane protein
MIRSKPAFVFLLCLALLGTGAPGVAVAQEIVAPDSASEAPAKAPADSPDRIDLHSPLSTTQGFMRAAEVGDYETASEHLDSRYLPKNLAGVDTALLAEQLYVVISRELRIDFGALSDKPGGLESDGLPSFRDVLGQIDSDRGKRPIYLQRVPGPSETRVWKISNVTVARIPELHAEFGYSPMLEAIRGASPDVSFLGAELFKWIIAILAGLGGALAWLAIARPLRKILTRRDVANTLLVKRYLTRPVPAAIFMLVGSSVLRDLGLGVTANRIIGSGTLVTLVIVWLLFASLNLFRDVYARLLRARGRDSGVMLLRPITSTTKVVVGALAIVIWLDNVGIDVTALIAGLGVGGLAVALVLQKPLEDILGALTLYTQQPVRVGQFCTCGDVTGTVEEINLRTTRIRTISNTIVVIPNATFATASIENFTERPRILHRQTVRLALDTSESTLRSALEGLREVLMATEEVRDELSRVRLVGFGEFSINIEIFAHVDTTDWVKFLAIAEEINLGTVNVLEGIGAKFAKPPR